MNSTFENEIESTQAIKKVCEFFRFDCPEVHSKDTKEAIKEVCVARLCQAIGLSLYNVKSEFFDFFSSIIGEAVCEKLSIKVRIAYDELRLVKYDHINLVGEVKWFLDNETIEEAFLDAFNLVDRFKFLIPKLKKV